ncbi:MAG: hypothetical protein B7733_17160 [Myxococcales bacterium FL481]|nr:MAG: hypothetical protein B7733_17160 [Myxococcales bacterium FL481]
MAETPSRPAGPHPLPTRWRSQAGFTMAEVIVSLIVFIVAVVGVVAMQARGVEAQRAAMELHEGERIASQTMATLAATGFNELVETDFAGNDAPGMPYSDHALGTERVVDFRAVPADGDDVRRPGSRPQFYWVGRMVSPIPEDVVPAGDPSVVDALALDVLVMWIDTTSPALPPDDDGRVDELVPDNVEAGTDDFKPWVAHVRLRTVRVNDGS